MLLEVEGLSRAYGANVVVSDVTFTLGSGQMLALLGPNGCGKSTTMKILSGAIRASGGHWRVNGLDGHSGAVRSLIGYVPDTRGLFPRLSGAEHLQLAASLAGMTDFTHRAQMLLERLDLAHVSHIRAGAYSHGQSRRLSLAMALLPDPALLLVDEPYDGVDPAGVEVISALLADAVRGGAGVLLTTHLMEAAAMADKVCVIDRGVSRGPWKTSDLLNEHGSMHRAWLAVCAQPHA